MKRILTILFLAVLLAACAGPSGPTGPVEPSVAQATQTPSNPEIWNKALSGDATLEAEHPEYFYTIPEWLALSCSGAIETYDLPEGEILEICSNIGEGVESAGVGLTIMLVPVPGPVDDAMALEKIAGAWKGVDGVYKFVLVVTGLATSYAYGQAAGQVHTIQNQGNLTDSQAVAAEFGAVVSTTITWDNIPTYISTEVDALSIDQIYALDGIDIAALQYRQLPGGEGTHEKKLSGPGGDLYVSYANSGGNCSGFYIWGHLNIPNKSFAVDSPTSKHDGPCDWSDIAKGVGDMFQTLKNLVETNYFTAADFTNYVVPWMKWIFTIVWFVGMQ